MQTIMNKFKNKYWLNHIQSLHQRLFGLWPVAILIVQNLVIFYKHYFYDFGFPWDFFQGYYATTAFGRLL